MKKGFTLIEMVIVVTILGLLLVISMMSWRQQLNKARDAQRKEDLQRISIAFEEWFSDFGCYPDAAVLNNCGGPELMPYLAKIPCDPVTREPYQYIVDEDNPTCYENYKILALLANEADPAVADLGCGTDLGCGYDGAFNYGVSSKNVAVPSGTLPSPSPLASPGASASPGTSPSPSAAPAGNYYCQTIGNCTVYDPALWSCSPNYADPNCDNPTNPCISAGSCTRL